MRAATGAARPGVAPSGCRCGEGTLTVRHSLQRVGGRLTPVTPKSKTSEWTLSLLGLIATVLEEHRVRQQAEREAAGEDWQADTGLVFTSTVGTP